MQQSASEQKQHSHRYRLLDGMTAAVARKGYSAVTIADVVAAAGVSKRTFYEHFSGKEDCLLAGYVKGSAAMMAAVRRELSLGAGQSNLIGSVLETYLGFLDRDPQLAATLLIEVQRSGAEGRRIYRRNNLELAELIRNQVARCDGPPGSFDLDQSIALVGGINELILSHAEAAPTVPFRTLLPAMTRFVQAVVG